MKVIGIIFLFFLFLGALLYYLIQQSKKPSGIVGVLMLKFQKLLSKKPKNYLLQLFFN